MLSGLLAHRGGGKKSKERDEMRWGRSFTIAGLMIAFVVVASVVTMHHINETERERCFERLYQEAGDIAASIRRSANNDREQLMLLSQVVAQYEDLADPGLWKLLCSFDNVGMMAQVSLLLPDNTVIYGPGQRLDATGTLSFEQEAAKGAHISYRSTSLINPEEYVLRHFMPIIRDGQVVALLYGVILIQHFPVLVGMTPYAGAGSMYIVEGKSGNFLMDTWHPGQVGNIWDLGTRKMAPGYDASFLKQGMVHGRSDYVVFISRTTGEYLYLHYQPLGINDWSIAISVPEKVVFASSDFIAAIFHKFLFVELLCFALYLLWLFHDVRQVTAEKQKRLEAIQNIHEIEQLLFNAHERSENLTAALERLGTIMAAGAVDFWLFEGGSNRNYHWQRGEAARERSSDEAPQLSVELLQNFATGTELYEAYNSEKIATFLNPEVAQRLHSLVMVPVRDVVSGQLSGVLAVSNLKYDALNVPVIKAMSFSFGMFCNNVKNRTELQEQGDRDRLTGMLNRNRYERDLPQLLERHSDDLACIYIDVNGLRELNNTKGHDLGDIMLRTVAQGIVRYFPCQYGYRVGGDEFVLFVPHGSEDELSYASAALAQSLLEHNYHISVGIESAQDITDLAVLIKAAEQKMYDQKRAFYATRERRVMHVS